MEEHVRQCSSRCLHRSACVGLQALVAARASRPGRSVPSGLWELPGSPGSRHAQGGTALLSCAPRVPRCSGLSLSSPVCVGPGVLGAGNAVLPAQSKPETARMQFRQRPPRAWGQAAGAVPGRPWAATWGLGGGERELLLGACTRWTGRLGATGGACPEQAVTGIKDSLNLGQDFGRTFFTLVKSLKIALLTTQCKRAELV